MSGREATPWAVLVPFVLLWLAAWLGGRRWR